MDYFDAHDPPWLNKLYIYLLCFITGAVILAFVAVVVFFDSRGVHRRWWRRRRHHHNPGHNQRSAVSITPANRNGPAVDRSAKWVVMWVLMALVGIAGLMDLSLIVDYKTRGHRWFLINWRHHTIHR